MLFGYLEDSVIEVTAPNGGVFHPKITILRYVVDPESTGELGEEQPAGSIRYRLLCASRNLTFDRSWDTLLILEGGLDSSRVKAFSRNRPLSRFVAALPTMAVRSVSKEVKADIGLIADELLRVRFDLPEGFDELSFWPLGLDGQAIWPFSTRSDRILVMSPFVDQAFLKRMVDQTGELHLISRSEAMDALSKESLDGCNSVFTLSDSAQSLEPRAEPDDESGPKSTTEVVHPEEDIEIEPSDAPLRGLHAKLFIADAGWTSKVWTGSANATTAAFERNVEFLIELTGRASRHGVRALLRESNDENGRDRHIEFRDLLVPYHRINDVGADDPVARKLEDLIDQAKATLINAHLFARVYPHEIDGKQSYALIVEATHSSLALPHEVMLQLRPISLPNDCVVPLARLDHQPIAEFRTLSFEALTGFLAFEATATWQGRKQTSGFVLNLPLIGAPTDRENRLLLALLNNRQRLLRYLLMLLADSEVDPRGLFGEGHSIGRENSNDAHETPFGLPLLEPLMRALDRDPRRLERVARLVDDLRCTEQGREIVPQEFWAIWEPIWSAGREKSDARA